MVSQATLIEPLRFSTGDMREPARELRAFNERKVVLPLEPLAGSVVRADIVQWPYPQLGILSAQLCGLRHGAKAGPVLAGNEDQAYLGITLAGRSIDLAFWVGFGDLSYFNRAFRRRYGATPSDIRRYGHERRCEGEKAKPHSAYSIF